MKTIHKKMIKRISSSIMVLYNLIGANDLNFLIQFI